MWLYKDGQEVYCDKDQIALFEADGWSRTKEVPVKVPNKVSAKDSDHEDLDEDLDDTDNQATKPIKKILKVK